MLLMLPFQMSQQVQQKQFRCHTTFIMEKEINSSLVILSSHKQLVLLRQDAMLSELIQKLEIQQILTGQKEKNIWVCLYRIQITLEMLRTILNYLKSLKKTKSFLLLLLIFYHLILLNLQMKWELILLVVPLKEWEFQWHLVVHIQDILQQVPNLFEKCQAESQVLVRTSMATKHSE